MNGTNGATAIHSVAPAKVAETKVHGYTTLAEYLRDYEDEIVLRVDMFMARRDRRGRKAKTDPTAQKLAAAEERRRARTAATRIHLPLAHLVAELALSPEEETLLAYLLFLREGVRLPAALGRYGDREFRTFRVALAIAVGDPAASYTHRHLIAADAPLLRADLIAEMEVRDSLSDVNLTLTPAATALLLDDDAAFSHLHRGITIERPTETLEDVVLVPDARQLIERSVLHRSAYLAERARLGLEAKVTYGTATVMLFHGAPGTGKTLTARAIAGSLRRPLVVIDPAAHDPWSNPTEVLSIGMAEARRLGGIVFIDEIEHLVARTEERRLLGFLESADTIVILATNHAQALTAAIERRILHKVLFPLPDADLRRAIWKRHLPDLDEEIASDLGRRYWMSGGYIKNAVLAAVQIASAQTPSGAGTTHDHLCEAAAEQSLRFEETLDGMVHIVPTDPNMHPPADFDAETIDEVRSLLKTVIAAAAGREPPPRVVLAGRNGDTLIDAARYLAAGIGQPLLRMGEIDTTTIDKDEATAKRRMFRALIAGSSRQFSALVPIGHDFLPRAAAYSMLDMIADIPSVIFIALMDSDAAAGNRLGDVLVTIDQKVRRLGPVDLMRTTSDARIAVGDVDWGRVNAEVRSHPSSALGLCRLALAVALKRGATVPVTEDFLSAIALARRTSASTPTFGRV